MAVEMASTGDRAPWSYSLRTKILLSDPDSASRSAIRQRKMGRKGFMDSLRGTLYYYSRPCPFFYEFLLR